MNERLPPPGYYDQFDGYAMYRSGGASFSMTPSGWTINAPILTIQGEDVNDGYSSKNNKQMNVKMTEEDAKDIAEINQLFFEGEATNSMLGRILLRKGIQFYKKLRANL